MSRKDYEAIALGIATTYGLSTVDKMKVAQSVADSIAHLNPRFDRDRFMDAATKDIYDLKESL